MNVELTGGPGGGPGRARGRKTGGGPGGKAAGMGAKLGECVLRCRAGASECFVMLFPRQKQCRVVNYPEDILGPITEVNGVGVTAFPLKITYFSASGGCTR